MVPQFRSDGLLPAGVHLAKDWAEFLETFGFSPRRQALLAGLKRALLSLKEAGCQTVYVDGSFVTAKQEPGDYDACWDLTGVDVARIDPVLLRFDNGRVAQKIKFGGELFPAQLPEGLSGLTFLEFFQVDKESGDPKGIVALDLQGMKP